MADPKPSKAQQQQQQQQQQPPESDVQQVTEEVLTTSSDARFASYREASPDELDLADEQLPPGRHVIQERGEPSEGGGEPFNAQRGGRY